MRLSVGLGDTLELILLLDGVGVGGALREYEWRRKQGCQHSNTGRPSAQRTSVQSGSSMDHMLTTSSQANRPAYATSIFHICHPARSCSPAAIVSLSFHKALPLARTQPPHVQPVSPFPHNPQENKQPSPAICNSDTPSNASLNNSYLGGVDQLISQALGDGLDVAERGLASASAQKPDGLRCSVHCACIHQ